MPAVFCEKLQSVKLHLYSTGIDTVSKPLQNAAFMVILFTTSFLESYYHIRNPKSRLWLCRGASSYRRFLRRSWNPSLHSLLQFNITNVWPSGPTLGLNIHRCPVALVFTTGYWKQEIWLSLKWIHLLRIHLLWHQTSFFPSCLSLSTLF